MVFLHHNIKTLCTLPAWLNKFGKFQGAKSLCASQTAVLYVKGCVIMIQFRSCITCARRYSYKNTRFAGRHVQRFMLLTKTHEIKIMITFIFLRHYSYFYRFIKIIFPKNVKSGSAIIRVPP